MATITSVGSGLWSSASTWDNGVPVDGDDCVISDGHVVTFDADQSAFATGVKVTINGTLTHTTSSGNYCLFAKTGASIVGSGTWNIGTSDTPIPFASKHTITGAAGWYVDGVNGLTMNVFGAEPTYKYVKLSAAEAAGQTELSVDTDVTGDIWAAGDIVRIDNVNRTNNSEERVIATGGIATDTITVTAGLTAAKLAGTYVLLITRNIRIIAVGTGTRTIYRVGSSNNKLTIGGGMFYGVNKYMLESCSYLAISGGTFSGNNGGLYNCFNASISGGIFSGNNYGLQSCGNASISGGTFSGNTYGLQSCANAIISGGTFSGNTYGLQVCNFSVISGGTFSGNYYGLFNSSAVNISSVAFSGNNYDLTRIDGRLFNTILASTIEHGDYPLMNPNVTNCQSDKHNGVDGALKAWCKGGVVTSQTAVKPDGYNQAYLLDPESATLPVFFTKQFSVGAGQTFSVEVQLRKDASMTYLPRAYLMASISNPLAGATPVDSFIMTDSIDTWETDTFGIVNTTAYDQDYTLWFVAQNASGNAYAAYDAEILSADLTDVIARLTTIDSIVDDILVDTGTTLPASIATVQADLDNPDQYKADISALALEATLTAIKAKTDLMDASSINIVSPISGTEITILRGDTFECSISGLGSLASYVSLDFTVKSDKSAADSAAIIRIRLNASGLSDGLLTLNGAAALNADDGAIVITDAVAGDITITLAASCTDDLATSTYVYDVQLIEAAGEVSTLTSGNARVIADVTRAVS